MSLCRPAMKQEEIQPRQNRIVYILMVVLATAGLAWALWEHMRA